MRGAFGKQGHGGATIEFGHDASSLVRESSYGLFTFGVAFDPSAAPSTSSSLLSATAKSKSKKTPSKFWGKDKKRSEEDGGHAAAPKGVHYGWWRGGNIPLSRVRARHPLPLTSRAVEPPPAPGSKVGK